MQPVVRHLLVVHHERWAWQMCVSVHVAVCCHHQICVAGQQKTFDAPEVTSRSESAHKQMCLFPADLVISLFLSCDVCNPPCTQPCSWLSQSPGSATAGQTLNSHVALICFFLKADTSVVSVWLKPKFISTIAWEKLRIYVQEPFK